MLGSPGSKPWTTSKLPCSSASRRFARTPTGTPRLERREIGTAVPIAIVVGAVAARQRAAAGGEIGRPSGRGEHGDRVAQRAQLLRDAGDMLVDVVWQ